MLSMAEAHTLCDLCSAGRLYEVEEWARTRSLQVPRLSQTPLRVAITRGFHSLVELLLRHESSADAKDFALDYAVKRRRLDLARLAIDHGADIRRASFWHILAAAANAEEAMYFVRLGADVRTDAPFSSAMRAIPSKRIVATIRACISEGGDAAAAARDQASALLRSFVASHKNEWVTPLLRAGADPSVEGPKAEHLHRKRGDYPHSAYVDACINGNVDALRIMRPPLDEDSLAKLLEYASWHAHALVIEYLVHIGAPVNDPRTGASMPLVHCVTCLHYDRSYNADIVEGLPVVLPSYRPSSRRAIRFLIERGAKWNGSLAEFHCTLADLHPDIGAETLELFIAHSAAPDESLQYLVDGLSRQREWAHQIPGLNALLAKSPKQRQRLLVKRSKERDLD